MTSYRILEDLMQALPADGPSGHGVRMRVANFFFDKPIEQNAEEYEKMLEIEATQVCAGSATVTIIILSNILRSTALNGTLRW